MDAKESKEAAPFLSLARPSITNSENPLNNSIIADPKLLSVTLKNQM